MGGFAVADGQPRMAWLYGALDPLRLIASIEIPNSIINAINEYENGC
jgi:hypothetical protein